jgi:hypothetical protein
MARGRRFFGLVAQSEEDTRPVGAVRFADPSTAEFPRHIHTFNEPHSPRSTGECSGVRSQTGEYVPWPDRRTDANVWEAMNRKRGVFESEDD